MSLFTVRDLHVHYRGSRGRVAHAVDGVSLDWRHAEVLGVVGESGCGKSTLARAMLGLVPAAGGEIEVEGAAGPGRRRDARAAAARADGVPGPLPVAQPAHARARDRGRAARRPGRARRRARGARGPGAGGRRAARRRASPTAIRTSSPAASASASRSRPRSCSSPDGLICDEPVSMLDVSVRAQVLKVLMDLRESRSLALLFITHDLGLAWTLCDRIAVMYLGRIVEQGSARQVIETPRHPYTQALVAAVPSPGRRRRRAAAGRRAARCRPHPAGLPPAPALPAPLRAVRQRGSGRSTRPATATTAPPATSSAALPSGSAPA